LLERATVLFARPEKSAPFSGRENRIRSAETVSKVLDDEGTRVVPLGTEHWLADESGTDERTASTSESR
jgi:hypothetical protein